MKNFSEKTTLSYHNLFKIVLFFCILFLFSDFGYGQLPAFPGAEGAGALSVGGRGGTIIEVTNLNDAGAGSLRAACQTGGPRTVIFRIGGTIELQSAIRIWDPYITIAGQTAPGDGIQIIGPESREDLFILYTHDIIIRYIRFRHGYNSNVITQAGCGISVANGSYNVIVDHCSFQWSMNDLLSIWSNEDANYNCTFSNNILAEAFSVHSTCMIFGGDNPEEILDMDVHHNLFANASHRHPLFKGKRCRLINNISYNHSWFATGIAGGVTMDIIANQYKKGPNSLEPNRSEIAWRSDYLSPDSGPTGPPSIYIVNNDGWSANSPSDDNWIMLEDCGVWDPSNNSLPVSYKRTSPLSPNGPAITVGRVDTFVEKLLEHVGASEHLDVTGNWVDMRDEVDARIIQEYRDGTGIIPDNEDQVGGFPNLDGGTPYTDADGDGMSDAWEDAMGLNKNNASDGNEDADGDGYTNVEEFINGSDEIIPPTPIEQTPYGGSPWTVPGRIQAEDYDNGGEGIAYHDLVTGNEPGEYRQDDVDIEVSSDVDGGYQLGYSGDGEWVEYTTNVTITGDYRIDARVASAVNGQFHIYIDDEDVTEAIDFDATGSWSTWTTISTPEITLSEGEHVIRFEFSSPGFCLNWIDFKEITDDEENPVPVESIASEIQVFPLPYFRLLYIRIGEMVEKVDVSVVTTQGTQVYSNILYGNSTTRIRLSKGMYVAVFSANNEVVTKKIVLQ